jgi:hypothetical protein
MLPRKKKGTFPRRRGEFSPMTGGIFPDMGGIFPELRPETVAAVSLENA